MTVFDPWALIERICEREQLCAQIGEDGLLMFWRAS